MFAPRERAERCGSVSPAPRAFQPAGCSRSPLGAGGGTQQGTGHKERREAGTPRRARGATRRMLWRGGSPAERPPPKL